MEKKRLCDFAKAEIKTFEFTYYEQGERNEHIFDSDLMIDDESYEWEFSIVEAVDDILSLKVDETMWLRAIRGDNQSKGVVCRIK